jgi:hypothetical protein
MIGGAAAAVAVKPTSDGISRIFSVVFMIVPFTGFFPLILL